VSVELAQARLRRALSGSVDRDVPMARHTTYRIGGPVDLHVTCDTLHDLTRAVEILHAEEIPCVILGKGSNVLVSDEGYRGAVLALGREFKQHELSEGHLRAGAGCILSALVQEAYSKGLTGLEFAVGIPGTLGGALAMNAGSRDEWIEQVVDSVTLHVPDEGLVRLRGVDVGWSYRASDLTQRGIVVECEMRVEDGDPAKIRRRMDQSFSRRKTTQPVGVACAGSVFVNPEGDSAGRMIESAGMKGAHSGAASVSDVHANFIVNEGGASARDVWSLIQRVRSSVKDMYGIELQTEIRFLGPFEDA
jgi:UDP-N-acetylmuramate dehydrogenase